MAQKHQRDTSTTPCPNPECREPVEPGDLFCGACGYDLTVPPVPEGGTPGAGERVSWPEAEPARGPATPVGTQLPGELPGVDSRGARLVEFPDAGPGAPAGPGEPTAEPPSGLSFEPAPERSPGLSSGPAPERSPGPSSEPAPEPADVSVPEPPAAAPAAGRTPPPAPATGETLCVACRAGRVDTDGYCENCGHAQPRERDHVERDLGTLAAVSDRGLRHHRNEDAFAVNTVPTDDGGCALVAVVCDGVSSASRPDEASAVASAAADASLAAALRRGTHPQQAMHEAIVAAARAVNSLADDGGGAEERESQRRRNAPACTFVGAVVTGGLLVVGWVGDSRAYWVPDDRTTTSVRLTEDDSWAAQMVAAGLMNEAEAYADERAHAITGWLGADAYELEPHTASFKSDRPGTVLVCTDGLWNYAEGVEEIARAVPADAAARPLHAAQVLVGYALDAGGHDNVTVAVLPFALAPAGADSACTAS